MKYIKKFDNMNNNFKSKDDWKIGDIIVATHTQYDNHGKWVVDDRKYKIIGFDTESLLKTKIYILDIDDNTPLYHSYSKNGFVDLEQWETTLASKKYNL